jgi:L-ribulose-5-phosphate 3-epimerase
MTWIQTGSTIIFKPYPLEQALDGLAEAGFANVEIGAVKGFLEHLDPDNLTAQTIERTRAALASRGLRCVSMSGHAPLHTEEGTRRLRNVLRAGSALGVEVLNTFTGEAAGDEEIARFKANVRALADEAQEAGVRLCLETDSNLLPTAETGVRLLEEIGHPGIRINYDPGNVRYYAGADPNEDVKYAFPSLGHVHLKDQRGGKGVADFPPLGEGEIDIPSLLFDLRSIEFTGPVSMEIEFTNYEWPSFEECVAAAKRGKAYWDAVSSDLP